MFYLGFEAGALHLERQTFRLETLHTTVILSLLMLRVHKAKTTNL